MDSFSCPSFILHTLIQPSLYSILFHGIVLFGIAVWPALPDHSFDFAINRNSPAMELIASQLPSEASTFEMLANPDSIDREYHDVVQKGESKSQALPFDPEAAATKAPEVPPPLPLPQISIPVITISPSDEVLGIQAVQADFSNNQPPQYPAAAIQSRLEGTAILKLLVDADGSVKEVTVVETSGHEVLDQAAIDAVKKWKGKPAQRFGINISSEELLPIRFRL